MADLDRHTDHQVAMRAHRFKKAAEELMAATHAGEGYIVAERELRGAAWEIVRGDDRPVDVTSFIHRDVHYVGVELASGIFIVTTL